MLNTLSNKRTITALLHNAAVKWGDQPYMYKKTDKGWVADSFKDVDEKSSLIAAFIIGKLKLHVFLLPCLKKKLQPLHRCAEF